MNVKSTAGEGSEGSEEHSRESIHCLREYVYHHKQNIGRNINVTGAAVNWAQGNEEHVIGNWRKENPYYIRQKT